MKDSHRAQGPFHSLRGGGSALPFAPRGFAFRDEETDPGDPKGGSSTAALEEAVKSSVEAMGEKVKTAVTKRVDDVETKLAAQAEEDKKRWEATKAQLDAIARQNRAHGGLLGYKAPDDPDDPSCPSLGRMVVGHMLGWPSSFKSGPEYELAHEMQKAVAQNPWYAEKADGQQGGIGSSGGLFISTSMFPEILKALEANSVAEAAGVPAMTDLPPGDLHIPREDGGITAYFKGESKAITESKDSYSEVRLHARELVGLARTSKKLLMLTSGRMRNFLERRLGLKLALRRDLAFFKGSGDPEPVGVINAPVPAGVTVTTEFNDYDDLGADQNASVKLNGMITALKARNAYNGYGEVMWFGNPKAFGALRNVRDADGNSIRLFSQIASDAEMGVSRNDRLLGHRYAETTQLDADSDSDFLLFPVEAAALAMWDVMEIRVSEDADPVFINNELFVRAVSYVDSALFRGEHVQRATNWDLT